MNSKEDQTNSEVTNLENKSSKENQKDANQVKNPREPGRESSSARSSSKNQNGRYTVGTNKKKPRDNSSRFDD